VIYIENSVRLTELPLQRQLGKCCIFQVIVVPDTAAYQFWKNIGCFKLFLYFLLHDLSKATFISAQSAQYTACCLQKLLMSLQKARLCYKFPHIAFIFSLLPCNVAIRREKLICNKEQTNFAQPNGKPRTVLC